jgi:rRNA small subunit pseudouridine methyltransferase Nep1
MAVETMRSTSTTMAPRRRRHSGTAGSETLLPHTRIALAQTTIEPPPRPRSTPARERKVQRFAKNGAIVAEQGEDSAVRDDDEDDNDEEEFHGVGTAGQKSSTGRGEDVHMQIDSAAYSYSSSSSTSSRSTSPIQPQPQHHSGSIAFLKNNAERPTKPLPNRGKNVGQQQMKSSPSTTMDTFVTSPAASQVQAQAQKAQNPLPIVANPSMLPVQHHVARTTSGMAPGSGTGQRKLYVVLEQACLEAYRITSGGGKGRNGREGEVKYTLLNCDDHQGILAKTGRDIADARPDITHQCLLTLLDSPLNKAGLLQVYIHTAKGVLIEVNPHVRIPRTFKRFSGLMVQLLHKLSIRGVNGPEKLLKVIKNPITDHLPPNTIKLSSYSQQCYLFYNIHSRCRGLHSTEYLVLRFILFVFRLLRCSPIVFHFHFYLSLVDGRVS